MEIADLSVRTWPWGVPSGRREINADMLKYIAINRQNWWHLNSFFAPISVLWDVIHVGHISITYLALTSKRRCITHWNVSCPGRRYKFRTAVQLTFVGWHMRRDGALQMLCMVPQTVKLGFHSRAQTVKHYHDGVFLWPTTRRMALCHRGVVPGHWSSFKVHNDVWWGFIEVELESCECPNLRPPAVYI
jgi:hypothetical protein